MLDGRVILMAKGSPCSAQQPSIEVLALLHVGPRQLHAYSLGAGEAKADGEHSVHQILHVHHVDPIPFPVSVVDTDPLGRYGGRVRQPILPKQLHDLLGDADQLLPESPASHISEKLLEVRQKLTNMHMHNTASTLQETAACSRTCPRAKVH